MFQFFEDVQQMVIFDLIFGIDAGLTSSSSWPTRVPRFSLSVSVRRLLRNGCEKLWQYDQTFRQFFREAGTLPSSLPASFEVFDHRRLPAGSCAEHDRVQHRFFRQFIGFRFNHQDAFFGTGNRQFEFGFFLFVDDGVQNELAVFVPDFGGADPVP